ncbi:hypothetical protein [Pseudomonas sp. Hp2]|uniref:hypothetical protein n=1 Tax=Pseudomonas sp. Hp2 TaxID=701189 RepID=UPI00112D532F|nr:hypothetical protein [Pseudomonas sp. Hp2]
MLGWNVVGKRVFLISGEGPSSATLTGVSGLIEDVSTGQFGQEVIRVVLDRAILVNGASLAEIFLVPRHRGYGSVALATTCIAVYVIDKLGTASEPIMDEGSILALMDVRVRDGLNNTLRRFSF